MRLTMVTAVTAVILIATGCDHSNRSGSKSKTILTEKFACPASDCEVGTDKESMIALVMHQTDTPGDNGIFDSADRYKMYIDAVRAKKIVKIADGTRAQLLHMTPSGSGSTKRYSTVKILEGPYTDKIVIVQDRYVVPLSF